MAGLGFGDPYSMAAQASISGIQSLIGVITGLSQKRKASRLMGDLKEPTIPNEYLQNQGLAQLRANTGLPTAQYKQAEQNIYRQQNAALSARKDRRGGLMGIGALNQQTNDALLGLDVANANARVRNEGTLMNANSQVGNWRSQNAREKYNRDYGYAMQLMGAGNQNFTSGLDYAGAGLIYGLQGSGGGGGGYSDEPLSYNPPNRYVPGTNSRRPMGAIGG